MADSLIFNGHDLSELVMCRFGRQVLPPVSNIVQDIPGKHGALFRNMRYGAITQPVTIWLRSEDRRKTASIRRQLAALLHTDEPAPLYLPDEPEIYYLAIVDGETSLSDIVNDEVPETTINFLIVDPIGYGATETATVASGASSALTIGGTWKTYPVATIRPTSTSAARITNVTTAEFVEINSTTAGASLSTSSDYVFDMEKERVTRNGATVGVTADSDFFSVKNGDIIKAIGCKITLEWRQRWL